MVERITPSMKDAESTYRGLSTDIKPTTNVSSNDAFYELDTGRCFVYSALNINPTTNDGWWEV